MPENRASNHGTLDRHGILCPAPDVPSYGEYRCADVQVAYHPADLSYGDSERFGRVCDCGTHGRSEVVDRFWHRSLLVHTGVLPYGSML